MVNSVAGAKLSAVPENSCTLEDIEACFNGVQEIYTVGENGQMVETKETYLGESYFAYYYCTSCGEDWRETAMQDQDKCWKLAKEHLNES